MTQPRLPLLVEPAELEKSLGFEQLLIVDLCQADTYSRLHLPGAVHLEYRDIVTANRPVMGGLPDASHLSEVFSRIGLTPESHVVAYDDEGGGRAARLLWTLDVVGHANFSLLNGGLHAWTAEHRQVAHEPVIPQAIHYQASFTGQSAADKNYILNHLNDPSVALLDTRSPGEFTGKDIRAKRGGHIPGAANFNWVDAMDQEHHLRIKPQDELRRVLSGLGVTPDKEIIAYCQTHHRSAHTYMVLKILGYENIRGYAGSWSEWGNSDDTPIE